MKILWIALCLIVLAVSPSVAGDYIPIPVQPYDLEGWVVSVDYQAETLEVRTGSGLVTVAADSETLVGLGMQVIRFSGLSPGYWVRVWYRQGEEPLTDLIDAFYSQP